MYLLLIERNRPHRLLYQEALIARTSPTHPNYLLLKEKIRRRSAGFAGEVQFDRVCAEYRLNTHFNMIPDFKMPNYQIDAICIFPSFILIVEVKNISGSIHMDGDKRQFSRTLHGITTGMNNPDDQLYRHEKLIRKMIGSHIPIIGIAVFANPSAVVEVKNIKRHVIHLSGLHYLLDELVALYRTASKIDIDKYTEKIVALQPPMQPPIPPAIPYPLLEGVFCPHCPSTKMNYSRNYWRCTRCNKKQLDAHLFALQEYRLLIGPTISNREFRKFTGLSSRMNAWIILHGCNFQTIGNRKSLRYVIPEIDLRRS